MRTLVGELNPQKYLKKLVVFYRETTKCCSCADELLTIYEHLTVRLIKEGLTSKLALFRMPLIIEKLLKMDDPVYSVG